ncbi:MAG: nucleoside hydrolase, partial [Bryobacter sp.]|nr:nucleoside hydrolase [Bryobacter sp.]
MLLLSLPVLAQTRVWLDADTANEIDDLYAITRVLQAKEVELVALSSAQWKSSPAAEGNTLEQSQALNEALLGVAGRGELPHPRGSMVPLYWWGQDRAAYSGAAYHLMLEARKASPEKKLTVVALGALTNVATALLMDPAIAPRMRLYWLGARVKQGVWDKSEFNALNDIAALNIVLDAEPLELLVMPANVAEALTFDYERTMRELGRQGRWGELLAARWKQHAPGAGRWVMWDLAAVDWLLHPEWVKSEEQSTPPENRARKVRVATGIEAAKMRDDFWASWGRP